MPRWRFNSSLLQESEFKEALRSQINTYIALNVATAPSAGVAWEALKAVVRGFVIQYASYKKKKSVMKQREIENKIKKLATDLKKCFNGNVFRELIKLKYDHNRFLSLGCDKNTLNQGTK